MNKLQIFNNEQFGQVRAIEKRGEPYFILADLCRILEIDNSRNVSRRLDEDEKGVHSVDTLKGKQRMTVVNESGMYAVILRSDKPQAKAFRKWITAEVLPSIRKTGAYSILPVDPLEQKRLNVREAEILLQISEGKRPDYKQILECHATKALTGVFLLPLPVAEKQTHSAGDIGEKLGVSAKKIGSLANLHNLKTAEFGKWFYDKSQYSNKQVESFRYYDSAIAVFAKLLGKEM